MTFAKLTLILLQTTQRLDVNFVELCVVTRISLGKNYHPSKVEDFAVSKAI